MDLKDNNKSNPSRKHGNQSSPAASSHALRDFVPRTSDREVAKFFTPEGISPTEKMFPKGKRKGH